MKKIKAVIVSTKEELNNALAKESLVIIATDEVYEKMKDAALRCQKSKIAKKGGVASVVTGALLFSSGLGALIIGGGVVTYLLGKNADSLKKYKIEIDEIKQEIILYKCKGKEKYRFDDVIER